MHQMGHLAEESVMYLIMSKNLLSFYTGFCCVFFFPPHLGDLMGKKEGIHSKGNVSVFTVVAVDRFCWTVSGVPKYIFLSVSCVVFSS